MVRKNFIGIDYSINSPAMCTITSYNGRLSYSFVGFHHYKTAPATMMRTLYDGLINIKIVYYPDKWTDKMDRYHHSALAFFYEYGNKFIVENTTTYIEDYNYNPKRNKNNIIDMVEATMCFKAMLYRDKFKYHQISIPTIKKHIAGSGAAEKSQIQQIMLDYFMREHNLDLADLPKQICDMFVKGWTASPFEDFADAWATAKMCYDQHK